MLGTLQFCCQCSPETFGYQLGVEGGLVMMYIRRLRSALVHFMPSFYPPYAGYAAVLLVQETSGCVWGGGGGGGRGV